jgi:hypothetical protein
LITEFDDPLFSLPADLSNEAINEIMENAKIFYKKNLPSSKKAKASAVPQRLLEVVTNSQVLLNLNPRTIKTNSAS